MIRKEFIVNDYQRVVKFVAYLLLLLISIRYAQEIVNGGNMWKTGDWLINYKGGWIRRGLIGQLIYESSRFGIGLLSSALIIQVSTYLVTFHLVLRLFFSVKRDLSWLIVLFSPAFIFLFPFYDPIGGFRKEIIIFLSFCLLAVGLQTEKLNRKYVNLSLTIYAVAVLSHEIAAICVIFFLYIIFRAMQRNSTMRLDGRYYLFGFAAVALIGLLFSTLYSGGAGASGPICQSLIEKKLDSAICGGAIVWLDRSALYGFDKVIEEMPGYLFAYGPLFAMALVPLFITDWWKRNLSIILLGFIFLLPVFFVAIDWGRFIHIYIFLIFILLIFDSCHEKIEIKMLSALSIFAYCCLWSIPHCCSPRPGFGVIEFVFKLVEKIWVWRGALA